MANSVIFLDKEMYDSAAEEVKEHLRTSHTKGGRNVYSVIGVSYGEFKLPDKGEVLYIDDIPYKVSSTLPRNYSRMNGLESPLELTIQVLLKKLS